MLMMWSEMVLMWMWNNKMLYKMNETIDDNHSNIDINKSTKDTY